MPAPVGDGEAERHLYYGRAGCLSHRYPIAHAYHHAHTPRPAPPPLRRASASRAENPSGPPRPARILPALVWVTTGRQGEGAGFGVRAGRTITCIVPRAYCPTVQ